MCIMMIKYRVHEVAKDLNVPNKEVLDILAKYVKEPKKHMTALEENELDIVFDKFTQDHAVKDFDFTERMAQTYGDRIAVGVDARDGYVAVSGWKELSAERAWTLPPPPGRGRPDRHLYGHQPGWGGTGHQSGALPGAGKN